jgi:hypothetical protein
MTSREESLPSAPAWVGPCRALRARGAPRFELRRRSEAGAVAALAVVWVLLWTFFGIAVVEPAARVHASSRPATAPPLTATVVASAEDRGTAGDRARDTATPQATAALVPARK